MSSKLAIIIRMSLALILTSTLSSAQPINNCPGFKSVSDLLRHNDIPGGLFPDNVRSFGCKLISINEWKLTIDLYGVCKVTKELVFVGNQIVCQKQISATLSYRLLSDIQGVTVSLTFKGDPVGDLMTMKQAKIEQVGFIKFLKFFSDKGDSPSFPVYMIPNNPPHCDNKDTFDEVFNYGRPLLRLVD